MGYVFLRLSPIHLHFLTVSRTGRLKHLDDPCDDVTHWIGKLPNWKVRK